MLTVTHEPTDKNRKTKRKQKYNNVSTDTKNSTHTPMARATISGKYRLRITQKHRKIPPIPCTNPKCYTWRENQKELTKHIQYHCRLTRNEKEFYEFPNANDHINSRNPREIGIPNCELYLRNNHVTYGHIAIQWQCVM